MDSNNGISAEYDDFSAQDFLFKLYDLGKNLGRYKDYYPEPEFYSIIEDSLYIVDTTVFDAAVECLVIVLNFLKQIRSINASGLDDQNYERLLSLLRELYRQNTEIFSEMMAHEINEIKEYSTPKHTIELIDKYALGQWIIRGFSFMQTETYKGKIGLQRERGLNYVLDEHEMVPIISKHNYIVKSLRSICSSASLTIAPAASATKLTLEISKHQQFINKKRAQAYYSLQEMNGHQNVQLLLNDNNISFYCYCCHYQHSISVATCSICYKPVCYCGACHCDPTFIKDYTDDMVSYWDHDEPSESQIQEERYAELAALSEYDYDPSTSDYKWTDDSENHARADDEGWYYDDETNL